MNQQQSQERPAYDRLPFFSILAGILGFLACCNPPLQLICGSTALILAWLSKKEQPLKPQAIVGIILGCICILFSFFIFFQYMWAMNIMEDPANAGIIKEIQFIRIIAVPKIKNRDSLFFEARLLRPEHTFP